MMYTKISLLKYPTSEDWAFVKQCALVTAGKKMKNEPDLIWKQAILRARHSPIRTMQFAFYIEGVPYWVSTHLVRHVHAQPFVRSQRNDRQDKYDRNEARQDAPVDMIWYMNAEELLTIAEKRLCRQTAEETMEVAREMCRLVEEQCPEFKGFLAPVCVKLKVCNEMRPCGVGRRLQSKDEEDSENAKD